MSYHQQINDPYYRQMLQQYLQPQIDKVVSEKVASERAHEKIRDSKAVWFYPGFFDKKDSMLTDNWIKARSAYVGEQNGMPRWDVGIANLDKLNRAKGVAEASDSYDQQVGAFYPEFQEDAKAFLDAGGLHSAEGGIMTSADFTPIKLVFTISELLNIQQRIYTLPDAVTTKQTNMLNIMVAKYDRFQISEDLAELEAPESKKGQFSTTQFSLRKAGGQVSYSDEFMMQNWLVDPWPVSLQNMTSDMVRIKAKKIATQLATAQTTTGGSPLDAFSGTTEHSNVNAITLFTKAKKEIYDNFGTASRVAMSELTLDAYLANTFVKPLINTPQQLSPTDGQLALPGQPGLTAYIDNSLSDGTAFIWDADAIWFIQGPIRNSTYRDELPGSTGMILRDWHKCVVRDSTRLRKLTSLTT